jgi:hypothetical protein
MTLTLGCKPRILPLAVANVLRVVGTPAWLLFHNKNSGQVPFDETPFCVFDRFPILIHSGPINFHGDDSSMRERLARFHHRGACGGDIDLTDGLVIGAIHSGVMDMVFIAGNCKKNWKNALMARVLSRNGMPKPTE